MSDSHWWYFSPAAVTTKFKDLGGEMLVELRSTGCQTIVEPSLHPDGGRYLWSRSGLEIETIEEAALLKACRELATAVLIARHLPATGRHDFALALAGFLLRNGQTDEAVLKVLTAAWSLKNAPREALRDLEGIVRDTRSRLDRSEPVKGGRTLEDLVGGMTKTLARYMGWEKADNRERPKTYTPSDLGNAERYIAMYGDKVRWCPALKSFLVYDGKRWARDDRGQVVRMAHDVARSIHNDAAIEQDPAKQREIAKFAIASQNEGRISGMLSQSKPYITVGMDELDRDQWAINCLNGTLNLRTGALRSHNPADLITKLAPVEYDPDADCPRFKQFLKETLIDDAVISFVKRFAGYTLTGVTRERLFAILHGSGKNGKTTLVELLQDVLGDYATNTDTETILAKKHQGVGNDVAALKGARFVSTAEVERGRRLAESKVKQLTGSDTVTARFLFCEPFNFRPEFKLWLSTNNKPVIQGTDDAIWDRIRLIPFTQRFEGGKADPKLPEKLREELSGILAWMVAGCLEWQEHGLGEPERVTNATNAYRSEMDTLAAFIDDRCVVAAGVSVPAEAIYRAYGEWCDASGEHKETQKMFGMRLTDRGFERARSTSGVNKGRSIWRGIGLRTDEKPPDGGGDGSPSEPCGGVGSPGGYPIDKPKNTSASSRGERSERKNQHLPKQNPRDAEVLEKRFTSFTSFTAGDVVAEINRTKSGPSLAYTHHQDLPSDDRFEYLVKAVLHARGVEVGCWEAAADVVREAVIELGGEL